MSDSLPEASRRPSRKKRLWHSLRLSRHPSHGDGRMAAGKDETIAGSVANGAASANGSGQTNGASRKKKVRRSRSLSHMISSLVRGVTSRSRTRNSKSPDRRDTLKSKGEEPRSPPPGCFDVGSRRAIRLLHSVGLGANVDAHQSVQHRRRTLGASRWPGASATSALPSPAEVVRAAVGARSNFRSARLCELSGRLAPRAAQATRAGAQSPSSAAKQQTTCSGWLHREEMAREAERIASDALAGTAVSLVAIARRKGLAFPLWFARSFEGGIEVSRLCAVVPAKR